MSKKKQHPEQAVHESHDEAVDLRDERIAELETKLAEAEARSLRALADFQNFQRRAATNEVEARRQGVTSVVMGLLPVLDNFALALQQRAAGASPEQILGGVEIVQAELYRALELQGVTKIDAEPGANIEINDVLLVGDGEKITVGAPKVAGAKVTATVKGHGRLDKVRIVKFRRRKHHRKQMGHRQHFTELEITGISA